MAFDGTLKFDTAIDQAGFKTGLSSIEHLSQSHSKILFETAVDESGVKSGLSEIKAIAGSSSTLAFDTTIDESGAKSGLSEIETIANSTSTIAYDTTIDESGAKSGLSEIETLANSGSKVEYESGINASGFKSGLSELENLAKSSISKIGGLISTGFVAVSGAVAAASGAAVAFGKKGVDAGMDFESGMAQVIATMGITKDTMQDGVNSFDLLSQAAKDAGANTTFSATEAAGALNYLALAGYDAATAADSLDAVLNLAAAGGLDLQYAADLATDAMAALGIEASKENLTHFGDQMAVTASKANTSVAQLGEAILTVGGTAKSLSGGVSEMNAALGVLANRGIKGAEGGTALRNMILSLSAPTDKAAAVLDKLGVSVLDDTGNMRSLNDVFRDLNTALSGMADGEKTQVLNDIFNKVDLKSAQAMLSGCGAEFENLQSAIGNCKDAMQKMANTMNDTLEGDIKSLKSKAEALGIAVYESMNLPLRDLAQLGGSYLGQLKDAFDTGGFDGAAQALGGILGDAMTHIGDYLPDITGIGNSIVSSLIEGISRNSGSIIETGLDMGLQMLSGFGDIAVNFLDLGGNLISSLAEGIEKKRLRITRISREVVRDLMKAIGENVPLMIEAGADIIGTLAESIVFNLPYITEYGNKAVQKIAKAVQDSLPDILQAGSDLIGAFGNSILGSLPVLLNCAIQIMQTLVKVIADPDDLSALISAGITIIQTLGGALLDNLQPLINAGMQVIGALIGVLSEPDAVTGLLQAGIGIIDGLVNAITQNVAPLASAAVQLITALGTALLGSIPLLLEAGVQIVTQLIQAISDPEALTGLLDAALNMVTTLGTLLVENLSPLLGAVIQMIATLGAWIGEHALDLVSAGLVIVNALIDAIMDNLPLLLEAAVQIVEGLAKGIEEDDGDVLLAIEQIIRKLLDFLLAPDTLGKIGETGGKIIRALIPAAVELAGDLLGFAMQLLPELDKALKKIKWGEAGKNIVAGIFAGMLGVELDYDEFFNNFGENWLEGFGEIWDNTIQGFKDFWNDILAIDLKQLGKDILGGIVNGVQDIDLGPLNGVKDKLLGGIKTLFGIQSPSKLMRDEIGKNLALGIEVGFEENIPDIGGDVKAALTGLPDMPELQIGFELNDAPELPDVVNIPVGFAVDDLPETDPEPVDIPVGFAVDDFPETDPEPVEIPVGFALDELPEPETPDSITIPIGYELPELPELEAPDDITVSLTEDAVRILEELRAAQIPVRTNIDPEALEALRISPVSDASALVPQSATSIVNNSYQYNNSSSTTNSTTTTNNTAESPAPSGDFIFPIQIGGEKIETVVMHAIELANARSGGGTI